MANEQVKRLFIREMQTETSMRYHFTPTKMAIIKKTVSVDKDMEKVEPLYCWWCVKYKMEKLLLRTVWQFVKKVNMGVPI